ncbi:MAG: prepilin peptidase [Proteobacteria bacterium]|nr:prepilin peptidase [Pseudomonadota bacterium]
MLLVADIACLVLCLIAVATDLKSYRIPNGLTLGGLALGLAFNASAGALQLGGPAGALQGLAAALAGALLLGFVFGALGALGLLGMGDVKLLAAVGAWLRWPLALQTLVYVALAGGLVGLVWALTLGRLRAVLGNLRTLTGRLLARHPVAAAEATVLHRIPYAVAVFVGTAYAVATRYWPAMRLI